jgi:hypothetical protein
MYGLGNADTHYLLEGVDESIDNEIGSQVVNYVIN